MKWITAHNLEQWAENLAARTTFPALIADLIVASAPTIHSFRFPKREKGQVRGFDGTLEANGVPPYVPDGESIWEFGTTPNLLSKANEDFKKRTDEVDAAVRTRTTFVFASPRTWDHPGNQIPDWLAEKRALNQWKDVLCFDGVVIEDWLDKHPAVAAHYARNDLALTPQVGAYSTAEFWDEFSNRFDPPLAEEVLLAGRETQANDLVRRLGESRSRIKYGADSADEVVAFAVAAIRRADPALRAFFEARVLVIEAEDAARQLATKPNLVFLPRRQARQQAGLLASKGTTVISAGAGEQRSEHEILPRPTSSELAKAFVKMGYEESAGYQLARTCGRSLAVLARRIPSATATPPAWLQHQAALLPALLAGAWASSKSADTSVLTSLGGRDSYDEVEAPLRLLAREDDSPVDRIDDVWSMRSATDAFLYLGHSIGQEHLARFKQQMANVFAPEEKPPKEDELFQPRGRADQGHSYWLREGMMTTLLLMSALHRDAGFSVPGSSPSVFVEELVRDLPGLSSDHRFLSSFHEQIPHLAEAAPNSFLGALESLLEGDGEKIKPLFDEKVVLFSPESNHTGLLWALEVLAWNEDFLLRSAMCLAKLSAIDPGGRLSNRPINSLRSIFLAWSPRTNAPSKKRLAVVETVVQTVPAIAWELLEKLLPKVNDHSDSTQEPRFAEASPGGEEQLTYGVIWETQARIVKLAIEAAGTSVEHWNVLVSTLYAMRPSTYENTLSALEDVLPRLDGVAAVKVWDELRKELHRQRSLGGVEWAIPEERLGVMSRLVEKFKPADLLSVHSWLFDDWMPDVVSKRGDDDVAEAVEEARLSALQEIVAAHGINGVVELAGKVKLPLQLLEAFSHLPLAEQDYYQFVRLLFQAEDERKSLAISAVALAARKFKGSWTTRIAQVIVELSLEPVEAAKLFLAMGDSKEVWTLVEEFGQDVDREYWLQKGALGFRGSQEDLRFALRRYLNDKRPLAAIEAMYKRLADVESQSLMEILRTAIPEINRASGNSVHMMEHHVSKIFEELEKRVDVTKDELANLEFLYLPFFHRRKKPLTLHQFMVKDPEFFVSVLRAVFKSQTEDKKEISKDEQRLASAGYELLNTLTVIPGQSDEGIDFDALIEWCNAVRGLAEASGRGRIADSRIGHLLAHAPAESSDGAWPHLSIRRAVEALASEVLEEGIRVERMNMRGVYSKGMNEGGNQERALAAQARSWAAASQEYPRTAGLLAAIAEMWEELGKSEDVRAEKDALRW